ncbi:hypothetical protein ACFWOT_38315 [Streptomyces sp. NPDC058440]|uniref:hypothetical protein n=1 Tax=Streptomyces sp. NPDC058440 TaxID=3346501 RepID=UPI00364D9EC8
MAELARERGVSHYHLTTLARGWDLPILSTDHRYNAIGHLALAWTPCPAMPTVTSSPTALDRLRTIVQVPGHPSIAAAARAIYDDRDDALQHEDREDRRFRIIDRSANPLAPTPRGHDFLREATEVLHIADQTRPKSNAPWNRGAGRGKPDWFRCMTHAQSGSWGCGGLVRLPRSR